MTDPTGPDLLDERMDQRLKEYGAGWRDALPASAQPAPASAPRRRWLVPVAAAAAVAVVVGVTFAVTRSDDNPAPPEPADATATTSAPDAGVVPWAPLPGTFPDISATTLGPSGDEITAEPECRPADLRTGNQSLMEDGGGSLVLKLDLALASGAACHLPAGIPTVTMLAGGEPVDVEEHPYSGVPAAPVLIAPDDPAVVSIGWSAAGSCPPITNDRIRATLSPTETIGIDVTVPATCDLGRGRVPWVAPLQSSLGSEIQSPYLRLSVTGDLDLALEAGAPIAFEVTLTSPVDLPLDPCPDFRIGNIYDADIYGLNCAAVPHSDTDGRPYLPAAVPVTFAMELPFGDAGSGLITWELLVPGRPTLRGDVTTTAPTGTVSGTVTYNDGAAPGTIFPLASGDITFTSRDGDSGAGTSINPDGTYQVELAPGAYDIVVTSPLFGGPSGQKCRDAAGVTGGTVNQVDISCPFH